MISLTIQKLIYNNNLTDRISMKYIYQSSIECVSKYFFFLLSNFDLKNKMVTAILLLITGIVDLF